MKNSITFQKQKFNPMTQLNNEIYAVKVPEGANNFEICNYGLNDALEYDHKGTHAVDDLPPGSYTFLFCTSSATEEQAASVVEMVKLRGNVRYTDYTREYMWCETAIDSLRSLLRSKGCEGECAVVRKK